MKALLLEKRLRRRAPRPAFVMSAMCVLFACGLTAARADGGAKVLSEPRRIYDPSMHRVGITVEISENAEFFVVAAQGISTTYTSEFFCRKICPRREAYCYQQCSVGLYYVFDTSPAGAGTGLHRDSWTYVQACEEDDVCSAPLYEGHVQCDAAGGSGCPCWMFVRTDPEVSCGPDDPTIAAAAPE